MSSWDDLAAEVDYDPSQRAGLLSPYVKRRNSLIPVAAREANAASPRKGRDADAWNRVFSRAMARLAKEAGLLLLAGLLLATPALAAPVSLVWDPNPPVENVVAYRIFECPKLSTTGCTLLRELVETQADMEVPYGTHCFRATAVNAVGLSSDYSTEACVDLNRPSATNAFRVILYVPRPK